MTGDTPAQSRFVRARQRDRAAAMVGFSSDLVPAISQVGIDKLEITVAGTWRSHGVNGEALFENLLAMLDVEWFNRPETSRRGVVKLSLSSQDNGSTISECEVSVFSTQGDQGGIKVALTVNPTRTLAHLLARFDQGILPSDLRAELSALSPMTFFSQAPTGTILASLDNSTNWLPAPRHVRERLGEDYWDFFIFVFCEQLRTFCNLLLMEAAVEPSNEPTNRISSSSGDVSLDWGGVRVSSVESYFERYHAQAVAAVRRGGTALLAADHSVDFWRYAPQASSFHRENDRFSVGLKLTNIRRLSIYAKLRDRIRFEIRRKGKGDYRTLPTPTTGTMRLVDILQLERAVLLDAVRWDAIGELFAGPDRPEMADVAELISQVGAACADADDVAATINMLIFEGGISATNATQSTISNLQRRGIITRYRVRPRDLNRRISRYALTAPYLDIHLAIVDAFQKQE